MGCRISKRSRSRSRSRSGRENPFSPLTRGYSLPTATHHVVSLTSTTFGSLKLDSLDHPNIINHEAEAEAADQDDETATPPRSEANDKITRTPLLRTPPNEPAETINAWELMDGLEEDASPLRSFSMNSWLLPKLESPKSVWADHPEADGIADFDPEILSQFRKALDELSPPNTCRLQMRSPERSVRDRIRAFQERIDVKKENISPPRREDRVVIYFTSLRGVRRTYEDCCNVRTIFRGYGVRADERDVSMHHGFRQELHDLLGTETFGGLPSVFVKGRYVGGAEDVRLMHESGELGKLIQGCEKFKQGFGVGVACQGCGDVRFVPCHRCFGSCKVFDEDEEVFLRCPDCNENGIVCCPICFI